MFFCCCDELTVPLKYKSIIKLSYLIFIQIKRTFSADVDTEVRRQLASGKELLRIFAKAINSVSNGTGDVTVADVAVFTECQAPSGDNGTYYQMNADEMSTFDTSLQGVMNTSMAMVNVFILIILHVIVK